MPLDLTPKQPPYYQTTNVPSTITQRLSDAQIKVPGSKVLLIQEANTIYSLTKAIITFNWVADYTNINPAAMIQLTAGSGFRLWSTQLPGWIFANGATTTGFMLPLIELASGQYIGQMQPTADWINGNIELNIYNAASGNFTGGNAANTLDIILFYNITKL